MSKTRLRHKAFIFLPFIHKKKSLQTQTPFSALPDYKIGHFSNVTAAILSKAKAAPLYKMAAEHFRLAQNGGQALPSQRLATTSQVTWAGFTYIPEVNPPTWPVT